MRTYKEVLEDGIQLLETAAIEEARLDAWLLLEYTADITRAWYYAHMDDGRAWRWPAQTWNAIGYISLLLSGVFGLKKDIEGIWFEGFIPTVLSEIRIFNLRYVNMCLDVSSEGEGKIVKMTLDGVEVKKIFWNLQGHHKVKLICRKED